MLDMGFRDFQSTPSFEICFQQPRLNVGPFAETADLIARSLVISSKTTVSPSLGLQWPGDQKALNHDRQ
jgi:hypothetical protein